MRVSVQFAVEQAPWPELVDYVVEAERLGAELCWVAEAWGGDAVTPIGFLAARTERMRFGSGIMQLGARTPALTAMTALTLARITGDRYCLGLGASGPRVMEGLHGVRHGNAAGRMRETVEIVRLALAGERLEHAGRHFPLPLPDGEGAALRLALPANPAIPIYLATLSPRMLELTGEIADGWLGTSFVPEAASTSLEPLAAGAARAGRSLADLDICQGAEVAFGDDVEEMVARRKPGMAFSLGGMGSAATNFYNRAYARQGWEEAAAEVQRLWVAGRRDEAAARVPDDMVLATTLIGTESMVRERLRRWADAGVTTVRLYPAGDTLGARLATLARAIEMIREIAVSHA
ncbi:MAG TPA: LLM class flavin-dependent oxidoreductase [Candidatus Dormibacteraeota bacterium]|nr:LLM class flavin-dependent oxidoreductase [Candidatus Dormibacteraeota bacterium]